MTPDAPTGREGWPRHPWHDGRPGPVYVACAACLRPWRIHGGPVPPRGWVCGDCRQTEALTPQIDVDAITCMN